MQNRPRQALALLLTGLFAALLFAACGDNTPTTAPSTTVAVGTAASTTAAAATTVASAATTAAASTTSAAAATTAAAGTTAAAATTTAGGAATTAAATGSGTTAAGGGAVVACNAPVAAASNGKTYRIGISVQNSIPDLVAAINGFKKGMEQCGFVDGKNVKYDLQNALGDIPSLTTISKKFADDKVDMIAAIGTAALVAGYNATKDQNIPIVFNSVTNPYVAIPGVIKTETDHSPYITGIQALVNIETVMKTIQEVAPNAKNIGLIYNPAEINSKFLRDQSQEVAKKLGLNLVEASIAQSSEVLTAAQSIADKVDVFYTTTDVTVVNALPSLVKVATDNKKPLIASNPQSAERGAAVAVGIDYFDVGILSAIKGAAVLDGKKPGDLPIEGIKVTHLYINTKAAEQMGLKIPDSVVTRAEQKYTDIKS